MLGISMAGLLLMLLQEPAPDRLSVQHQGRTAITAKREDYRLPVIPLYDPYRFDRLADELERRIYLAPSDARIGPAGEIVKEKPGSRLNRPAFADLFSAYYYGSGPGAFEAPTLPVYAKVDSELLAAIREKPIGYYVTYYNTGNRNRSHNIALAAKAIDGTVVFPGESFSFNRTVGMRTPQRGYLQAPVIVRGELSEDIGGGICQVSSTLFNAIDRAGMKIKERYSHSRHVPYVLPGRDATVSWGGPDFVFENPYNQPALIRASASDGRMVVMIYSSELIEYKPRNVPGMSSRLPQEISLKTGARSGFGRG
ncbi:hypothetical protein J19TS2_21490 [Cohnella xylanilytica]|uniref:VanW family protein n=1 Tax=Cohnella xylanilytica TaxID=557555 RepID=A0A841UCD8_9BACL|nr:VanW family protein [Cohnella xylanilytica]MBB6695611.1 VanW family protein [Cohnella xylanilytica]GIO12594.1 hypothetical protein J19TS2_21490 [Cohnella xylanilytica]